MPPKTNTFGLSAPAGADGGSAGSSGAVRPDGAAQFLPLYQQIKSLLTQSLEAGEWKPGEVIPSEMELAARFRVSQGTVRKAIDELAKENLVVRRQGKGTFVASHNDEPRKGFKFMRLMADDGRALTTQSDILDCRRLRAPADVARQLDLKVGESVVQLRRLLSINDRPGVLDEIWLPGSIFRGLTADKLTGYKGPLYGLFEKEYGTRMVRADERLKAVSADAGSAQSLGVEVGAPLLLIERIAYTYLDRPVEFRRGLYVTREHHYHNEVS
ncbi:GntR family transcriptional regulator [Derxia gummosa]|uniref:GntR family transcriptional regulator n=1 Tax=Derxia gummosa DSM 723 TaxID=1121388 RepID=A0A8B6X700_9BURK|nr:GntR family transcriptional regulator [Derxia gummosa]